MSRIFLLRHAQSVANAKGILAGRLPNYPLSTEGLKQREALLDRLAEVFFDQVISSPIQRCIETIAPIYPAPQIVEDFQEVHYGDWSGKRMSSLARNRAWKEIHRNPASVRFPNGETLIEVQTRALRGVDFSVLTPSQRGKSKVKRNILISTHADVIKVLILHALGSHLNNIDKVVIDNASISVLDYGAGGLRVVRVNDDTSKIKELIK